MEKQKYDLCIEVLRRMQKEGLLDKTLLVGSWCLLFYKDYFNGCSLLPIIRTRDLEFLFPVPFVFNHSVDMYELLRDLGFVLDYKGEQGYIIFQHPHLILEFLVPARGRESSQPFKIDQLGINAQALRFMDMLARSPIQMPFNDVTVRLPHPVDFALHKLLIAGRRKDSAKAYKDRAQAVALLFALDDAGEIETVHSVFEKLPNPWKQTIRQELIAQQDNRLANIVTGS